MGDAGETPTGGKRSRAGSSSTTEPTDVPRPRGPPPPLLYAPFGLGGVNLGMNQFFTTPPSPPPSPFLHRPARARNVSSVHTSNAAFPAARDHKMFMDPRRRHHMSLPHHRPRFEAVVHDLSVRAAWINPLAHAVTCTVSSTGASMQAGVNTNIPPHPHSLPTHLSFNWIPPHADADRLPQPGPSRPMQNRQHNSQHHGLNPIQHTTTDTVNSTGSCTHSGSNGLQRRVQDNVSTNSTVHRSQQLQLSSSPRLSPNGAMHSYTGGSAISSSAALPRYGTGSSSHSLGPIGVTGLASGGMSRFVVSEDAVASVFSHHGDLPISVPNGSPQSSGSTQSVPTGSREQPHVSMDSPSAGSFVGPMSSASSRSKGYVECRGRDEPAVPMPSGSSDPKGFVEPLECDEPDGVASGRSSRARNRIDSDPGDALCYIDFAGSISSDESGATPSRSCRRSSKSQAQEPGTPPNLSDPTLPGGLLNPHSSLSMVPGSFFHTHPASLAYPRLFVPLHPVPFFTPHLMGAGAIPSPAPLDARGVHRQPVLNGWPHSAPVMQLPHYNNGNQELTLRTVPMNRTQQFVRLPGGLQFPGFPGLPHQGILGSPHYSYSGPPSLGENRSLTRLPHAQMAGSPHSTFTGQAGFPHQAPTGSPHHSPYGSPHFSHTESPRQSELGSLHRAVNNANISEPNGARSVSSEPVPRIVSRVDHSYSMNPGGDVSKPPTDQKLPCPSGSACSDPSGPLHPVPGDSKQCRNAEQISTRNVSQSGLQKSSGLFDASRSADQNDTSPSPHPMPVNSADPDPSSIEPPGPTKSEKSYQYGSAHLSLNKSLYTGSRDPELNCKHAVRSDSTLTAPAGNRSCDPDRDPASGSKFLASNCSQNDSQDFVPSSPSCPLEFGSTQSSESSVTQESINNFLSFVLSASTYGQNITTQSSTPNNETTQVAPHVPHNTLRSDEPDFHQRVPQGKLSNDTSHFAVHVPQESSNGSVHSTQNAFGNTVSNCVNYMTSNTASTVSQCTYQTAALPLSEELTTQKRLSDSDIPISTTCVLQEAPNNDSLNFVLEGTPKADMVISVPHLLDRAQNSEALSPMHMQSHVLLTVLADACATRGLTDETPNGNLRSNAPPLHVDMRSKTDMFASPPDISGSMYPRTPPRASQSQDLDDTREMPILSPHPSEDILRKMIKASECFMHLLLLSQKVDTLLRKRQAVRADEEGERWSVSSESSAGSVSSEGSIHKNRFPQFTPLSHGDFDSPDSGTYVTSDCEDHLQYRASVGSLDCQHLSQMNHLLDPIYGLFDEEEISSLEQKDLDSLRQELQDIVMRAKEIRKLGKLIDTTDDEDREDEDCFESPVERDWSTKNTPTPEKNSSTEKHTDYTFKCIARNNTEEKVQDPSQQKTSGPTAGRRRATPRGRGGTGPRPRPATPRADVGPTTLAHSDSAEDRGSSSCFSVVDNMPEEDLAEKMRSSLVRTVTDIDSDTIKEQSCSAHHDSSEDRNCATMNSPMEIVEDVNENSVCIAHNTEAESFIEKSCDEDYSKTTGENYFSACVLSSKDLNKSIHDTEMSESNEVTNYLAKDSVITLNKLVEESSGRTGSNGKTSEVCVTVNAREGDQYDIHFTSKKSCDQLGKITAESDEFADNTESVESLPEQKKVNAIAARSPPRHRAPSETEGARCLSGLCESAEDLFREIQPVLNVFQNAASCHARWCYHMSEFDPLDKMNLEIMDMFHLLTFANCSTLSKYFNCNL